MNWHILTYSFYYSFLMNFEIRFSYYALGSDHFFTSIYSFQQMTRDWEVKRRGSIFLLLDTARNKVQDTALLPCTLKWKCLFLSTVALASLWGGWVKPHCTSHEGARRGHKTNEGSIKQGNPVSPTEPASTVLLFYYNYLKLIQLYCCFYKVFTAPLKFFLFHQCFCCIAVHMKFQLLLWSFDCFNNVPTVLQSILHYKVIVSMMS